MSNYIIHNSSLVTLFLLSLSTSVVAQDINSYEDYKLYCSDAAYQYDVSSPDCGTYESQYKEQIQQDLKPKAIKETQPEELQKSNLNNQNSDIEGYVGISLGAFFPDLDNADTGFGGSIFLGAKWNKYFGTDLEVILLGGGSDFEERNYSAQAISLNPRFFIPLSDSLSRNTANLFISPGLGFSSAEIDFDDIGISIEDDTRFTWQIKAGVSVPFSDRVDGLAQVRYADQFEEDTVNFFSTELGVSVSF